MSFLVNLLEETPIAKASVLAYKSSRNSNEISGKTFVNDLDGIVLTNLLSETRLPVRRHLGDSRAVRTW